MIGGAFTTHISWRWCFYLNLPVGAVAAALVFTFLSTPSQTSSNKTLKEKIKQFNAIGLLALLPSVICLCLALQWGGTLYEVSCRTQLCSDESTVNQLKWNNARIIALLVLFVVLFSAFIGIQIWKPDQATLPPRVFTQRSVVSAFLVSCCLGSHLNMLCKSANSLQQKIEMLSDFEIRQPTICRFGSRLFKETRQSTAVSVYSQC